ncbi:DUF7544 domain-containing protein [Halanaeroarchaeum sulfurireducens]|uniref:Uncharacterized protein n=1 Tax=Halanaeroarchaeum sulfurireducens TaxID=1604004 RepID=A0A0F7PAP8_9EURY|nr:hypothetical protein [Halanaeroarchaeum sulfurireducens]AKH96699.1 hypothetical protein HLASF_0187 [Halanaeroarchaeum sulfurireducens]ALG81101.1 hypothetical protein HLASA_0187 [Halanaeroarchaeum sulfurireducens]
MALHAVDDLTDAFDATRSFLWPFEFGKWVRLAVLSLFVAGGSGGGGMSPGNASQYAPADGGAPGAMPGPGMDIAQFLDATLWAVVAIAVVLVGLGLFFAWLAAVFEFAFLESIRTDAVQLRRYVRRFRGEGTHLFGFRLLFGLAIALVVGAVALLVIGPTLMGLSQAPLLLALPLIPVVLIVLVLASVAYLFTTAFVAPIMLFENRGVISGWRRFWGVLRENWLQFGVFVILGLLVMAAIGILVGIAVALLGIAIAIPFAILFFGLVTLGPPSFTGIALVVLGIPFALLMLGVVAFVQVPVQTFLRYWALLVLGDVEPDLDLIPDQRSAVRE